GAGTIDAAADDSDVERSFLGIVHSVPRANDSRVSRPLLSPIPAVTVSDANNCDEVGTMSRYGALLAPFRIKHLTLRTRIASTAHAPGYAEDGMPKDRYQLYHAEKAKGGLALTMFGGSSTVSPECPATFGQIDVSEDRIIPYFQQFSDRVHAHGAALICQIAH